MCQSELLKSEILALLIFGVSPGKFVNSKFDGLISSLSRSDDNFHYLKSNIVTDTESFDVLNIATIFFVGF